MASPLDLPFSAFKAFYDSAVTIAGERPSGSFSTSCTVFVIDEGFADALDDLSGASTGYHTISVNLPKRGLTEAAWPLPFPPQVGDVITLESGVSFAVTSVNTIANDIYTMKARQK